MLALDLQAAGYFHLQIVAPSKEKFSITSVVGVAKKMVPVIPCVDGVSHGPISMAVKISTLGLKCSILHRLTSLW